MISRTWHGIVPKHKRDGFEVYLNQTGIKEAIEIDGNRGAYIQIVDQNEYSHFFLCTVWSTWEDIILYAGNKPYVAKKAVNGRLTVDSWRLLERIGLRREAHCIEDVSFKNDENDNPIYVNSYFYALLKKEWKNIE